MDWSSSLLAMSMDTDSSSIDTSVHSYCIAVESDEYVRLQLVLDNHWTHRSLDNITDLCDLSIFFDNHELDMEENETWATISVCRMQENENEERKTLLCQSIRLGDNNDERLGIGPFISVFVKSSKLSSIERIVSVKKALKDNRDYSFMITVSLQTLQCDQMEEDENEENGDPTLKNSKFFGSKKVSIDDGIWYTCAEVLSLYSRFFLNLFYGDFIERNLDIINVVGVTKPELDDLINYSVFLRLFDFESLKSCCAFVDLADRFSFSIIPLFDNVKHFFESANFNLEDFRYILRLTDHFKSYDDKLLVRFLQRFPMASSLTTLYETNEEYFSLFTSSILIKRIAELLSVAKNRPKVCFTFTEGTVHVELFNDVYPLLINDLINVLKQGKTSITGRQLLHNSSSNISFPVFLGIEKIHEICSKDDVPFSLIIIEPLTMIDLIIQNDNNYIKFHKYKRASMIGVVISDATEMVTFSTLLDISVS